MTAREAEDKKGQAVCPESTIESSPGARRNFLKKAAIVTAGAAIGAGVLGRDIIPASSAYGPPVCGYCSGGGAGVTGTSKSGPGVTGISYSGPGVWATGSPGVHGCGSYYDTGVYGSSGKIGVKGASICCPIPCAPRGGKCPGVCGSSVSGPGVRGSSGCGGIGVCGSAPDTGVKGAGSTGVFGCSPEGTGVYAVGGSIGVRAVASTTCSVGLVVCAPFCSGANLQQWEIGCVPQSAVNRKGWLGIGTANPATSLQINGSISAKVATVSASYPMTTSDFAILANAASAALTVTLPPAGTSGMIVYVKKIDTSSNAVKVAAIKGDSIEGSASKSLTKKYASLTLLANGSSPGEWYLVSNAT